MQRFLDIVLSSLALLLLSPLLIPIIIILRLTGEGEVFFRQQRVGRKGQMFGLYKFATMMKDSPNLGTGTVTVKGDPRILPVGRILRKTKINELPQLLNILVGDMRVIGPRPQTPRCFDAFPVRSQDRIRSVRPGLSGIGSIVFRDEQEMMDAAGDPEDFYDNVIMPYKGQLEEWYVDNRSVYLYVQLIVLTVRVVLFPKSGIIWKAFPTLPRPGEALRPFIGPDSGPSLSGNGHR